MTLVLHGYWRSSAAYRVRIALNLKGVSYRQVTHDLRNGAQRQPGYRALAPIGLVPLLETGDGAPLTQSLAIMEWLEERFAAPALLPHGATARAAVRAMAYLIACDVHPINNLRVLETLRSDLGASRETVDSWVKRWILDGLAALEVMVRHSKQSFCYGETPGFADCCLIPQLYNARRFNVPLSDFPRLIAIERECLTLDTFADAAPEAQPDADRVAS